MIDLDFNSANVRERQQAASTRFYRAAAKFVYPRHAPVAAKKACRAKLLPLTAADLRQRGFESFASHRVRCNIDDEPSVPFCKHGQAARVPRTTLVVKA